MSPSDTERARYLAQRLAKIRTLVDGWYVPEPGAKVTVDGLHVNVTQGKGRKMEILGLIDDAIKDDADRPECEGFG